VIPSPAFDNSSGGIPNIVLLFIGTNDLGNAPTDGGSTAADMAYHLGVLMDKIIADAPSALLVVAQITPLPCCGYGSVVPQYNALIPGLAQTRVSAGKHVLIADMYTGFDATTMIYTDKIHPNSTGYNLIATRWYSAIQSVLPK
jgi:lysophospholipase L1-like esterase